jgi:hypothetical protein
MIHRNKIPMSGGNELHQVDYNFHKVEQGGRAMGATDSNFFPYHSKDHVNDVLL